MGDVVTTKLDVLDTSYKEACAYEAAQGPCSHTWRCRAAVAATDAAGRTALHMSASHDHATCVCLLLENNADVGVRDLQGETPLHQAVRYVSMYSSSGLISSVSMHSTKNLGMTIWA